MHHIFAFVSHQAISQTCGATLLSIFIMGQYYFAGLGHDQHVGALWPKGQAHIPHLSDCSLMYMVLGLFLDSFYFCELSCHSKVD